MKLEMTTGVEGVEFAQQSVQMTCTDEVTVGDVVELTLASGKYEACSKAETADITPEIIIGVAAEDTAAGAKGMIILSGTCKVKCDSEVTAGAVLRVSGDHAALPSFLTVFKASVARPTPANLKVAANDGGQSQRLAPLNSFIQHPRTNTTWYSPALHSPLAQAF